MSHKDLLSCIIKSRVCGVKQGVWLMGYGFLSWNWSGKVSFETIKLCTSGWHPGKNKKQ